MTKFIIMYLVLTSMVFGGCKRYEEGPITLRTPESRIRRRWSLQSFTLDGKDSMNFVKNNRLDGQWQFGAQYDMGSRLIIESNLSKGNGYNGYWEFDSSKENIVCTISNFGDNLWFDFNAGSFYIMKLTTKELKLQHVKSRAILHFRS